MQTKGVLQRYAAGERDFKRLRLRGANFRGANLAGADFSDCDIRGTNFTGANLTGVSFLGAKAGLRHRWAIFLVVVAIALSGVLAFFTGLFTAAIAALMVDPDYIRPEQIAVGLAFAIAYLIFAIASVRRGIEAGFSALALVVGIVLVLGIAVGAMSVGPVTSATAIAGAVAVAGVVAVIGALAIAVSITLAIALAIAGTISVVGVGIGVLAGAVAGAVALMGVGLGGAIAGVAAAAIAALMSLFGIYLGWRALEGDPHKPLLDPWLRYFALAHAATFGTCFHKANLTDADFTNATLKNTTFRQADLTGTCFRNAKKLNLACPGNTYLKTLLILHLLVTGTVPADKNFDQLNLRGINLSSLDLTDTSFIAADLSDANLKSANLIRARLVQTLLDRADLRNANLTGAFIEDWSITPETCLLSKTKAPDGSYTYDDYTHCDYIFRRLPPDKRPAFLKLSLEDSLNEDPRREPADWSLNFKPGEFVEYIRPLQETLDFYHRNVEDPRHIALALAQLQQQFPDAHLEAISMERRGPNNQDLLVRAKVEPTADRAAIHKAERQHYEAAQQLPATDLEKQVAILSGQVVALQAAVVGLASAPKTHYDISGNVGSAGNQGRQGNVSGQARGNQIGNPAQHPAAE